MIKQADIIFDYDRIIVLDACRYDALAKFIPGVKKVLSAGSCTPEWFKNTFTGRYDYTYITANPHIADHPILYEQYGYWASAHLDPRKIIPVWDFGWSDSLKTVPPNEVILAYLKRLPRKAILHFLQPHAPYIGPTGRRIRFSNDKPVTRMADLSEVAHYGREVLWQAYMESLAIALKEIMKLKGQWLITADHGDMFGERGVWSHPCCTRHPELVEVPFIFVDLDEIRDEVLGRIKEFEEVVRYG